MIPFLSCRDNGPALTTTGEEIEITEDLAGAFPGDLIIASPFSGESASESLSKAFKVVSVSEDETATDLDNLIGIAYGSNEEILAAAYAFDMEDSTATAVGTASEAINSMDVVDEETVTPTSFEEKKEKLTTQFTAKTSSDCVFTIDLFKKPPPVNCYGPTIVYQNHPDSYRLLKVGAIITKDINALAVPVGAPIAAPVDVAAIQAGKLSELDSPQVLTAGQTLAADSFSARAGLLNRSSVAAAMTGNGDLPGGDTGIWSEYNFTPDGSTGEACAAAKLTSLISEVSTKIDTATNLFAGMICMAKVEGEDTLPEINETLDLKSILENALPENVTVSTATIERLADDTETGYNVYSSHIAGYVEKGDGSKSANLDIRLIHSRPEESNNIYSGKLFYTIKSEKGGLPGRTPNCESGEDGTKMIAASIAYIKSNDEEIKYHIRTASYCNTDIDPFDDEHLIDPTKAQQAAEEDGVDLACASYSTEKDIASCEEQYALFLKSCTDATGGDTDICEEIIIERIKLADTRAIVMAPSADIVGTETGAKIFSADLSKKTEESKTVEDGWAGNFNVGTYEVNLVDGTGTYSHAWQARPNDQQTRTLVAKVEKNDDGVVSGCAYFGYGPDIVSDFDNVGTISGFICNWAGPGSEVFGEKTLLPLVQRQCMTRNENGIFVSESSKLNIAYAPSLSCNVEEGYEGFAFSSAFQIDEGEFIQTPDSITNNDKVYEGTMTNDLLDIDQMDIEIPTME